ncbi:hypothetical protein [Cryobacterium sp. AP23]
MLALAQDAEVRDAWVEVLRTAVPAFALLFGPAVAVFNAHAGSLRKSERLSDIAGKMTDSSERSLIEDLRDDYATTWALKQMAPQHNGLRGATVAIYALAGVILLAWMIISASSEDNLFSWSLYAVGIVVVSVAFLLQQRRNAKRMKWMRDERGKRYMRPPLHSRLLVAANAGT